MSALLEPLTHQHDMLLETRRRDGSWVPTPVNPVVENEHVFFRTWRESGKAKRLRNDPMVHLAPSTTRGRPTGRRFSGRATLLRGVDEQHAAAMINRRYPLLQGVAVPLFHRIRGFGTQHYVIADIRPDPVMAVDTRGDERKIHTLLDDWWSATRSSDVDALLALM